MMVTSLHTRVVIDLCTPNHSVPILPRKQNIGVFSCLLIHHGKNTTCRACDENRHKVGDQMCRAKPKKIIVPFKGYQHVLSNHYPCQLNVYEKHFRSLEHAYFRRMSTEFGKHDLATEIQNIAHAGKAKKLSKQIADDQEKLKWERDNVNIMKELLEIKAKQCIPFHDCLVEHKDHILAEATPSKFWASGLSPFVTENCSPDFWPGQNMLGMLLMEITETILQEENKHELEPSNTQENMQPTNKGSELSESDNANDDENTDEEDKTIEEDKMEVVNNESEPVNFITPEQEQSVHQPTSSDEHGSRSLHRESPLTRAPRNASSSDRRYRTASSCRGNTNQVKKVNKGPKERVPKTVMSTPKQIDIQTAFGTKRKPANSPED